MEEVDLLVVGCGTAGSRAAATAHAGGARVLAVEADRIGGLCILRGCMPTKTLLETAHRLHEIGQAERFGIVDATGRLDFAAMMERMRALVERFRRAKEAGVRSVGYEVRFARPRFVAPDRALVGGVEVCARTILLSAGSTTVEPPVPVAAGAPVVDSDAMFELTAPPRRAVVLGAGPVGLEFAQWLARVGAEVTLVNRSPLLRRKDLECGEELRRALSEEFTIQAPAKLLAIERGDGGALVRFETPDGVERTARGDFVLNALGRRPAYERIEGLDALGIREPPPEVGADLRVTGLPHVFAAGDMTGRRLILHDANVEGALVGRNVLRLLRGERELETLDPGFPPVEVVFTDPPFASAGLGPVELQARGIEYATAVKRFPEQGRGIVMGVRHGFLRLSAAPDGRLLGCQILGPRADDLIHAAAAALAFGATAEDLARRVPWYHPTLSEAFLETARELAGRTSGRS